MSCLIFGCVIAALIGISGVTEDNPHNRSNRNISAFLIIISLVIIPMIFYIAPSVISIIDNLRPEPVLPIITIL